MSQNQKHYVLLEWVEEGNMFPSYDVVNAKAVINCDETNLHPGKIIFVRTDNGTKAKQAQLLKIAGDKKQLKDQKVLLERQDRQVRNMLSMCMRTIKEIKAEPLQYVNQSNDAGVSNTFAAQSRRDSSDSSDSENKNQPHVLSKKPPINARAKSLQMTPRYGPSKNYSYLASSTPPLPTRRMKATPKLTFDQATQTDSVTEFPADKLEHMEIVLNHLYQQFLGLVGRLQLDCLDPIYDQLPHDLTAVKHDDYAENIGDRQKENLNSITNSELEDLCDESIEVRRLSDQTTNNKEQLITTLTIPERNMMVPIGLGYASVPASVIRSVNWTNYSAATRRLLQAVFPRNILATHSLSGKPSPAFVNRPAKKCLDPNLVDDIVTTVADNSKVPKNLVRKAISIMCSDESKLYSKRMCGRMTNISSCQNNEEQENVATGNTGT